MKKEKEEFEKKAGNSASDEEKKDNATSGSGAVAPVAAGRPKRQRKVPAHLKSGDFESTLIGQPKPEQAPKATAITKKEDTEEADSAKKEEEKMEVDEEKEKVPKEEPEESENDEDSEADWHSEDDPDRLWCICQQPHNNRYIDLGFEM
jgi:hypothetical protein